MRYSTSSALLTSFVIAASFTACERPNGPVGVHGPDSGALNMTGAGLVATATGGGEFDAGVPVDFAFSAVQRNEAGDASGELRFSTELGGLDIEFRGRVTCMTSDLANGRAWIGGIVTENNSEHPFFTQEIHEPGSDIWFRVVDYGEGADAVRVDRTTFVGFEGGGGIETTPEYCEIQPWPDADARTGPLNHGNIQVSG